MSKMNKSSMLAVALGCAVMCFASVSVAQSNPLPNHGMGMSVRNVPKYDYTPNGGVVMEKRYDANLTKNIFSSRKFPFKVNTKGIKALGKRDVLFRHVNNELSDEQKEVLREWGQPDYTRGPYRSSRGDQVTEWAYHQANHLFQFVDKEMVFEGPLTDQDRVMIQFGAPTERTVTQSEPGIRHEFWIYRPWYTTNFQEKIYKFSNGKIVYSQFAP